MLSKVSECITPKWASPWIAAVQNLNSSMTATHRWNLTAGVAAYNCPLTDPRTWLTYCLSHLFGKNTKHQNSFLALKFQKSRNSWKTPFANRDLQQRCNNKVLMEKQAHAWIVWWIRRTRKKPEYGHGQCPDWKGFVCRMQEPGLLLPPPSPSAEPIPGLRPAAPSQPDQQVCRKHTGAHPRRSRTTSEWLSNPKWHRSHLHLDKWLGAQSWLKQIPGSILCKMAELGIYVAERQAGGGIS